MRKQAYICFTLVLLFLFSCNRSKPAADIQLFKIAVPYELYSLDPHARDTLSDIAILSHFYEPLVTADADLTIRPCLAESWENPDPFTWIFHLRPDVKFHSGKKLDSNDVVFSLKRLQTGRNLDLQTYISDITSIDSPDNLTVRIRTRHPVQLMLNKLKLVPIVPATFLSSTENGTGPYRLVSWKENRVRMKRNLQYWRSGPEFDQVEFLLAQNADDAAKLLQAGDVHMAQCNNKNLTDNSQIKSVYNVLRGDSSYVLYVTFDLARDEMPFTSVHPNPFKKRNVRKALSLAINRKALVHRLPALAEIVTQPVPPFIYGYNPSIAPQLFDVEYARDLMRQEGLSDGFQATMLVRRIFEDPAAILRDQWRSIGVSLNLQVLSDAEVYQVLGRREFGLFLNRWACVTGDAADFLESTIHSVDPQRSFGKNNPAGYSNPELDHKIEAVGELTENSERNRVLQGILADVVQDLVVIPLYMDQDLYAIHSDFQWKPRKDSYVFAWEIHRTR